MATKTLTVTEDAYGILYRLKARTESFSEEITRLFGRKGTILDLAGAWSEMPDEVAEKMKREVTESRSKWGRRAKDRIQ